MRVHVDECANFRALEMRARAHRQQAANAAFDTHLIGRKFEFHPSKTRTHGQAIFKGRPHFIAFGRR